VSDMLGGLRDGSHGTSPLTDRSLAVIMGPMLEMSPTGSKRSTCRYAWFTVGYVGVVILFGAVVRVTGSGAGCGKHWPTCQGEIAHLPRSLETLIELSHRVTSGISLGLVLGLFWLIRRNFDASHPTRRLVTWALVFLLLESLFGAVLVLFGLVVGDRSMARAIVMPLHLANASMLMATLCLAAYGTTHELPARGRSRRRKEWQILALLGGLLGASMLGAVTALGDTLFPPRLTASIWSHIVEDNAARAHWLEHLRVVHPLVSVVVALYAIQIALAAILDVSATQLRRNIAKALLMTIICQLGVGIVNVWLDAPAAVQVMHLALALGAFNLAAILWAQIAWAAVDAGHVGAAAE
jgi:heme a synthase